MTEVGYREAVYKIPEKEFPSRPRPAEGQAPRHRRHHRLAPRLPHRRRDPGLHARRALRLGAGAGRHLQPDHQEALRRLLREHGAEQYLALAEASARRSTTASTASSSATAPTPWATPPRSCRSWCRTRRCPIVMVGLAALERPALVRRRAQPDPRGAGGGARRHRRGDGLHVRPDLGPLRPAPPRHPLPQDAQLLPQHLPHHRRHPAGHGSGDDFTYLSDDFRRRDRSRKVTRRRGLRRPGDHPLLLPGHAARPHRRARREGLPRASSSPAPGSATSTSRSTRRSSARSRRACTSS